MNHESPGTEKRLILAFALTLLVLVGWPYLMDKLGWAPQKPPQPIELSTLPKPIIQLDYGQTTPPYQSVEPIYSTYQSTSMIFGFSESSGSIVQLHIAPAAYKTEPGELELLTPADGPGLGAVAWSPSLQPWDGWEPAATPAVGQQAVYRGQPAPGIATELRYDLSDAARNGVTITLTAVNEGPTPQTIQPRLLGGRFLHDPLEQGRHRLLRASVAGKVRTVAPLPKTPSQQWEGTVGWVAAQTKYHTVILEPQTPATAGLIVATDAGGQPRAWVEWPAVALAPGERQVWRVRGYAGPLDYQFLDALKLDHAVTLGAFTTIARLLQAGMDAFTRLLRSPGAAIVVLTVLLSVLFYPLTWASFRTMKKMELVQPELKAIQERYRKDPKRMNEEVMKTYRKHGVNPLSGCLPLLLQLPIFMALYNVLTRSPELRGARFLLIQDLSAPDAILPLPTVLPLVGSAINILPLAMAGMMYLQQRMSMSQRVLTEEQRVQQQVFKFMPVLFGIMFYALPSGLVLYWLINTTLVVVQQQVMMRRLA